MKVMKKLIFILVWNALLTGLAQATELTPPRCEDMYQRYDAMLHEEGGEIPEDWRADPLAVAAFYLPMVLEGCEGHAGLHRLLAEVQLLRNELAAARRHSQRAVSLAPDDAEAAQVKAAVSVALGQPGQAVSDLTDFAGRVGVGGEGRLAACEALLSLEAYAPLLKHCSLADLPTSLSARMRKLRSQARQALVGG